MLFLEFVPRRLRQGVAVLPEGLDEDVPLPVRLELQEDVPLAAGDDVADLLVDPLPVSFGQDGLVLARDGRGRGQDGQEGDGRDPGVPHESLIFIL